MHFEILVEDQSGKRALDILVPKIIGGLHTFRVTSYNGLGRMPKNLSSGGDPSKRLLLSNLPRILAGYGKTFANYAENYAAAVILICDLDKRCLKAFRQDLLRILDACNPRPNARLCIAVEEGEAWFLGDLPAVQSAYPRAKSAVLKAYVNDSICGTWERLADAIYSGGSTALEAKGWQAVGAEKYQWADRISAHMDVDNNASPSFAYLRQTLLTLVENPT